MVTWAVTAFYIIVVVWPLLQLLQNSVTRKPANTLTLGHFTEFFTTKFYYGALINSVVVTVAVTILALIVAFPLAYIVTNIAIRGKSLIQVLILISMMSPPFIGAYSWILLLGRSGVITKFVRQTTGIELPTIYGFNGILLVLTLQLVPLIFTYLMGAWQTIDVSLLEAAQSMNCTGFRRLRIIVAPLILPTILSASLLVFMRAFADFGTPMLIGQGFQTIPVLIYNSTVSEIGTDAGLAAAISVVVIIAMLVIFLLQKTFATRKKFSMSATRHVQPHKVGLAKSIGAHVVVYGYIALAILPTLYVIYTAFQKTKLGIFVPGFSFDSFIQAWDSLGYTIWNTVYLGLISLVVVVVIAVLASYVIVRRRTKLTATVDTLTMVPYIVPGLIIGIAFLLTFNHAPLLITGTALIMIIALVIRRLPYTIRSSTAILYQVSPSVEEASISLGASKFKTLWRVNLPIMAPGIISGAILTWVTLITELSATIFLYTSKTQTLSIAVYTQVIRGQYGVAAALATMLTVLTVGSLFVFLRATRGRELTV